ncbi:MAG: hypothetical protein ACQGVK_05885 [Myxococcota bacterium]
MGDLQSVALRVLFVGAFGILALGVLERLVNAVGYTVMRGAFSGGRLLEISAVVVLFVVAVLLRQIRDELRARSA